MSPILASFASSRGDRSHKQATGNRNRKLQHHRTSSSDTWPPPAQPAGERIRCTVWKTHRGMPDKAPDKTHRSLPRVDCLDPVSRRARRTVVSEHRIGAFETPVRHQEAFRAVEKDRRGLDGLGELLRIFGIDPRIRLDDARAHRGVGVENVELEIDAAALGESEPIGTAVYGPGAPTRLSRLSAGTVGAAGSAGCRCSRLLRLVRGGSWRQAPMPALP